QAQAAEHRHGELEVVAIAVVERDRRGPPGQPPAGLQALDGLAQRDDGEARAEPAELALETAEGPPPRRRREPCGPDAVPAEDDEGPSRAPAHRDPFRPARPRSRASYPATVPSTVNSRSARRRAAAPIRALSSSSTISRRSD